MIQTYTIQTLNDIVSKNSMQIVNGTMTVQATNTMMYFTASTADYDQIAPWRWRIFTDRILTTMPFPDEGIEKAVDLAYYLSGRNKAEKLTFQDNNPLNVSRGNITGLHKRGSPSIITVHGQFATLHLNNKVNVKFDSKHVDLIDKFTWYVTFQKLNEKMNPIIRASGNSRINIHRLILGLNNGEDKTIKVIHKNNDPLDCRESNLAMYRGRQPNDIRN